MKLALHSNAYRDVDYPTAVKLMHQDAPGVGIEASTCREHLYGYFMRMERMIGLEDVPIGPAVAISGGWGDFVSGEGIEEEGIVDRQIAFSCLTGLPLRMFFCNPYKEASPDHGNMGNGIWNLAEVARRWKGECEPRIAIENHGGITAEPHRVNHIIAKAREFSGSDMIGTTIDPCNYARCKTNPLVWINQIHPDYVFHVHAKDMDERGEYCAPGKGLLTPAWKMIIKHLKAVNYKGVITYEYEGHDIENRTQHVVDGLNFLRDLIHG